MSGAVLNADFFPPLFLDNMLRLCMSEEPKKPGRVITITVGENSTFSFLKFKNFREGKKKKMKRKRGEGGGDGEAGHFERP